MTHPEDSLAEQAAAWVPPWQRELQPAPAAEADTTPTADPASEDTPSIEAAPSSAATLQELVLTVDDPVMAAELDSEAELDSDAEPDPDAGLELDPDAGLELNPDAELNRDAGLDQCVDLDVDAELDQAVEPTSAGLAERHVEPTEPEVEPFEPEVAVTELEVAPFEPKVAVLGTTLEELRQGVADQAEVKADAELVTAEPALDEPVIAEPTVAAPVAGLAVEVPSELAVMDPAELRAALEAILLVVDEPVGEIMLAQVLEQPTDRVFDALVTLAESYTAQGRGFELRRAAGGWRLYTREAYASYVERFILDGQSVRLTQAALETLAVVAYKQPVTRSRISAIRGVNCDGVVRTLVSRGLIEECGAEPDSGAHLYRTTGLFLEKLGLDGLDQLPPLAPFLPDNVEELSDATS